MTIQENIPPVYGEETVETPFSGEITDASAGSVEITNEDGSKATISVRDINGDFLEPGTQVVGSDGHTYEIQSVSGATDTKTIDALRVAHNVATALTGITAAIFILSKKKKGAGEGVEADGEVEQGTELQEIPVYIDLTTSELQGLTARFADIAGEESDAIANQFATDANMSLEEIAEQTGDPAEDSIFVNMTQPERTVAYTLLNNLHEPSSIHRLADMLGVNYRDFVESIGINIDEIVPPEDEGEDGDEPSLEQRIEDEEEEDNVNNQGEDIS